jgi:hypothetical protein
VARPGRDEREVECCGLVVGSCTLEYVAQKLGGKVEERMVSVAGDGHRGVDGHNGGESKGGLSSKVSNLQASQSGGVERRRARTGGVYTFFDGGRVGGATSAVDLRRLSGGSTPRRERGVSGGAGRGFPSPRTSAVPAARRAVAFGVQAGRNKPGLAFSRPHRG